MIKTIQPKEVLATINTSPLEVFLFYAENRTESDQEAINAVSEANATVGDFIYFLVPMQPKDAAEVQVMHVPQVRIYRRGNEIQTIKGPLPGEDFVNELRKARDL